MVFLGEVHIPQRFASYWYLSLEVHSLDSLLFAGAGRYTRVRLPPKGFLFWNLSRETSLSNVRRNLSRSRRWASTRSRANFAGRTRLQRWWTNFRRHLGRSWRLTSVKCASPGVWSLTG